MKPNSPELWGRNITPSSRLVVLTSRRILCPSCIKACFVETVRDLLSCEGLPGVVNRNPESTPLHVVRFLRRVPKSARRTLSI